MTDDEYRSEYSVFCLLAAPLIMSNDLSQWTPAMAATLLNKEMIAISQVRRNKPPLLFVFLLLFFSV